MIEVIVKDKDGNILSDEDLKNRDISKLVEHQIRLIDKKIMEIKQNVEKTG